MSYLRNFYSLFFLFILLINFQWAFGQSNENKIDSLKQLLKTAQNDSIKFDLYSELLQENELQNDWEAYIQNNYKAIQLAKTTGDKKKEWDFRIQNAAILAQTIGDFPKSLKEAFSILKEVEERNNSAYLGISNRLIASIYNEQKDYKNAIKYYLKVKEITKGENLQSHLGLVLYGNLGNTYANDNQLDSALYYTQRAYEIANGKIPKGKEEIYHYGLYVLSTNLGGIHRKKGNYDIALAYLNAAQKGGKENPLILPDVYQEKAQLYGVTNQKDSALFYAKKALAGKEEMKQLPEKADILKLIIDLYRSKQNNDSIVKYQDKWISLNEKLNSSEKIKETQRVTFDENARQQEMLEAKLKAEEERKNNLLTAGIVVFIPLFFGLISLLRRGKLKKSVISYLSFLGTLFLYEFISLLIHPFIGHITHHNPAYMIVIMVGIGTLLVPLHHKVEHWIISKMTAPHKPKKTVEK